jgi:hypothetical protein
MKKDMYARRKKSIEQVFADAKKGWYTMDNSQRRIKKQVRAGDAYF